MTPLMPRRSEELDVNEVDDGVIVYDESTDRVHHLNPTAAVILEFCDGRRTAPEIARAVAETFGLDEAPETETAACIAALVAQGLVS
ncbi:MAG TPA: HPr-rel-A system PqqD family peptide chaperone [Acidimicrobiales bacterium]|nr:HPr-rel-A system PqqD family peptide chaperone [Acidimicrobiales bacterium]